MSEKYSCFTLCPVLLLFSGQREGIIREYSGIQILVVLQNCNFMVIRRNILIRPQQQEGAGSQRCLPALSNTGQVRGASQGNKTCASGSSFAKRLLMSEASQIHETVPEYHILHRLVSSSQKFSCRSQVWSLHIYFPELTNGFPILKGSNQF